MKTILLISGLIALVSCGTTPNYNIDYSAIDMPGNTSLDAAGLDSLLAEEKKYAGLLFSPDYLCETDKQVYSIGEKIVVTIENKTDYPMCFFPVKTDAEMNHYFFSTGNKEAFEDYLVSKNPAFSGFPTYYDPGFVNINFAAVNHLTAAEMKLQAFNESISPGNKITFTVTMPKRAGHYRFIITRFSHDPATFELSGRDTHVLSNSFEVTE